MPEWLSRTQLLLGKEKIERLCGARVAVFGIGGVGGYAVEALARSGIGTLDLIDHDRVSASNLNRQIIATEKTVGQYKVDAAKERIRDINPGAVVHVHKVFFIPETAQAFDFTRYDYVVDAIDTVTGKLELAERACRCRIPIISSMGAGNKMDPTAFQVADISQTSVCPLARVMRRELKKRGIYHLKVVYSTEKPMILTECGEAGRETEQGITEDAFVSKKPIPGSNAFVPSVAGLIMAGEVVKDLTKFR